MKQFIVLIGVVLIITVGYLWWTSEPGIPAPTDENEVPDTDTGNDQGDTATTAQYKDLIRVESPLPESNVSSPLIIRGEARGNWYFEATFPVVLTNWDGLIIAEGYAEAQDEWMTTEYVPFEATLSFDTDTSVSDRGALILQKANASGLPEHDDAFEYTIFFEG